MRTFRSTCILAAVAVAAAALPVLAQAKRYTDIRYPSLPDLKIDKPQVFTLANGMKVFLLEDHELPLIEVQARIRTGSNYEPSEKTGLASLMGQVQRSGGTATLGGDSLDEFLAGRAASIETSVSGDSGFASMNCLKEDFEEVFRVYADVLRNPAFPQDKLDVAKVQANTAISRRNDEIGAIASREFTRLVYGSESPLARRTEYSTIAAVTRDDLASFHKAAYHPNNVMLGVVGDFDTKILRQKIESVFGNWAKGPESTIPPVALRKDGQPGVFFIEKSDVNQANIQIGHPGIQTSNPDYFAVQVMNEVLGGGFSARLFSNIRSKKGLAYSVGGGVGSGFVNPGLFRIAMSTKSQTMADAVVALKQEIEGILKNPPGDEELAKAKESILNSFVFNYDSKSDILSQQMTYAYYGLPEDFLDRFRASIEKVTKDQVAEVARKYVHPDRLTLLVVGKAADFDKPVSTFGPVTSVDITIPPPPDNAPKVAKSAEAASRGKALLAKAASLLGGPEAAKLGAVRNRSKMILSMGGQALSLGQTTLLVFPDRVRQTIQSPMGEQVIVIDGEEGFVVAGGRTTPLPAEALEKQRVEMNRALPFVIRSSADPALEAVSAGEDEVDGSHCQTVAVTFKGASSRLCIADDGKVLKQSYQGTHPLTRAPGNLELTLGDYREIQGRWVPFRQLMKIDGQEVMSIEVESMEFDPSVEADAFAKPAA